jgi:hypothetical protein
MGTCVEQKKRRKIEFNSSTQNKSHSLQERKVVYKHNKDSCPKIMSGKSYAVSGDTTEWDDILIKKGITTMENVLLGRTIH